MLGSGGGPVSEQIIDLRKLLAEDKAEWAESLDAIVAQYGADGAREVLPSLQNHVLSRAFPWTRPL